MTKVLLVFSLMRRGFDWLPWLVKLLIIALVAYLGPDMASRFWMSDEPTMMHYEGSGPAKTALVAYGGAGASPAAQFSSAIETFKVEAQDVFVPEYSDELFDADKVIDLVIGHTEKADGYDRIIFVGASMGGLLSYDTIKKMRDSGDDRSAGVVLVDSPLVNGTVGMSGFLKLLSNILNLGNLTNPWFPHGVLFDREKAEASYIAPDADRAKLEALWTSYETWEVSCWGDQGDYVFDHDETQRLPGVKWHFVRSGADDFVGPTAKSDWEKKQGPMPETVVDQGGHIAFQNIPNGPGGYNNAIQTGIRDVALAV